VPLASSGPIQQAVTSFLQCLFIRHIFFPSRFNNSVIDLLKCLHCVDLIILDSPKNSQPESSYILGINIPIFSQNHGIYIITIKKSFVILNEVKNLN
jgi:hypothetical protein